MPLGLVSSDATRHPYQHEPPLFDTPPHHGYVLHTTPRDYYRCHPSHDFPGSMVSVRSSGLTCASRASRQRILSRQRNHAHDNDSMAWQRHCRAYLAARTAKTALPFVALTCALCRASTHGKDIVVSFVAFAVSVARTTKDVFAVVSLTLACARGTRNPASCASDFKLLA
jgi:hypothetical protein